MKKMFLFFVIMFIGITGVNAEMISIDDVISNFGNTEFIKAISDDNSNLSIVKDGDNNKLNIVSGDETVVSYNYTDEYIEFDNRNIAVSEEVVAKNFFDILYLSSVLESVLITSGYNNKTISESMPDNISYDEYGIMFVSEHYSFENVSESGTYTSSGDFVKYFKISLDKEKIDKLMNDYGADINNNSSGFGVNLDVVPTIVASDITSNSVNLGVSVKSAKDLLGGEDTDNMLCMVYRSDSLDGEYTAISDAWGVCGEEIKFTDSGLKSSTTYYYKTKLMGSNNYSEPISITTLGDNTNSEEKIANPKTGNFGLMIAMIVVTISMFLLFCNRVKGNQVG